MNDHINKEPSLESLEEWQAYLSELLNQHGRKYKLVPMLKALR